MPIKIYNSLTRKKEEFKPLKESKIGMYVCGPTVYDEPHIGHLRSAYIFDVIRRYLIYRGYKVTFVRNVTDVDDKIINKAKEEYPSDDINEAVKKVSLKYLESYHQAMDIFGIMQPDAEPKATEYIEKMKEFIQTLIDKGVAYESGGDVYFDIKKAKNYGKLSNQSLEAMEAGTRIVPGENKKDPLDFALWKSAKESEPSWPSHWGNGRPGWHIECSVMSSDTLGDEFDIHGGGLDLIFPHHENEVAQSAGAGKNFARYWIHNGLLTINGQKMAKSLGNFVNVKNILEEYPKNAAADILKIFFLQNHYCIPINFSKDKMREAKIATYSLLEVLDDNFGIKDFAKLTPEDKKIVDDFRNKFEKSMDDDFNMPQGRAVIFEMVRYCNKLLDDYKKAPIQTLQGAIQYTRNTIHELGTKVFGLTLNKLDPHDPKWVDPELKVIVQEAMAETQKIDALIAKRTQLRKDKKFVEADEIRKILEKRVVIKDKEDSTTDWEWKK